MPSKNRLRRRGQESTTIASQAASQSLSIQPPSPPFANANLNERVGSSQSYSLLESRNVVIHDGQFNQIRGHHTNLVINLNHSETTSGSPPDSPSSSTPSNETDHINPAPSSGQSTQFKHERNQPQVSLHSQEIPLQKSNDIYERHLTPKGHGFPLWIPEPNRRLNLDYRRTGIRIGDVGIITHSGAFSFLFNICLPHNDPVNPQMLPERFAPISPPISPMDIEEFVVFKKGSHLTSASIEKSRTSVDTSGIVFESSASEGAILTMPRGAKAENLGNYARFRDYAAANVDDWYKFVNGPRGREAKNGDVRLVTGCDKTTSWGIATFSNQTRQHDFRLRFGPSEGTGLMTSASTYAWEYSGAAAEVRAGPDSNENDELRRDSDPPDIQFENQCLFVRTLNIILADDVWVDIHSRLGSVHVDPRHSQYPHVNNPHSNNPGTSSGSSSLPSQGVQSGIQRTAGSLYGLQDVDVMNNNPAMLISGPLESVTVHPSKVLNDILLAKVPHAAMVITHDDHWSSVITQYDTLPDLHEVIANILTSNYICEANGVIFLQPKGIQNDYNINHQVPSVFKTIEGSGQAVSSHNRINFSHGKKFLLNQSVNVNIEGSGWLLGTVVAIMTAIRSLTGSRVRVKYSSPYDSREHVTEVPDDPRFIRPLQQYSTLSHTFRSDLSRSEQIPSRSKQSPSRVQAESEQILSRF